MNCVRITCFQKPRIMTVCLLHFSQLQSKYIDIDLGNYSLQHVLKWSLRNIPHPLGHHNLIIVKQNVSEIFFNTHRIKIRQVCFLLKMCCSHFLSLECCIFILLQFSKIDHSGVFISPEQKESCSCTSRPARCNTFTVLTSFKLSCVVK